MIGCNLLSIHSGNLFTVFHHILRTINLFQYWHPDLFKVNGRIAIAFILLVAYWPNCIDPNIDLNLKQQNQYLGTLNVNRLQANCAIRQALNLQGHSPFQRDTKVASPSKELEKGSVFYTHTQQQQQQQQQSIVPSVCMELYRRIK